MEKQFFILLGRSGSGKGTQAEKLVSYLGQKGYPLVTHFTTGGNFREFINQDNFAAHLAKEVNSRGDLQPEFLAVWNWANLFITKVQENSTVILDGAPRKPFEAEVLHSAVTFFGYKNPVVVYLDASESVIKERLKHRGRDDDTDDDVAAKMKWFDENVLSTVDIYHRDPRYHFVHVNGNQTIDEVYNEMIEKLEKVA